jgi:hypothetical protein
VAMLTFTEAIGMATMTDLSPTSRQVRPLMR